MDYPTNEELAVRLAATERSLALVHAELSGLRKRARHGTATRAATVLLTISAAFASAMFWRGGTTYAGSTSKLTAPFVVTNSVGNRILFTIQDSDEGAQATLYNNDGLPVTAMIADQYGGRFAAFGRDLNSKAVIGVTEKGNGGMALFDAQSHPMMDLNRGDSGNQGLGLYNNEGDLMIQAITAGKDAAVIGVNSERESLVAATVVDNNNSGIRVSDPVFGKPIATLGLETVSEPGKPIPARFGLVVFGDKGDPVAAVYENHEGNGTVAVWKNGAAGQDTSKKNTGAALGVGDQGPALYLGGENGQASLAVPDGKPELDLTSSKGAAVVSIKESGHGTGYLSLGNSNGDSVVEAGVDEQGVGMVRAYPWNPINKFASLGLPGSEIKGRPKGGEGGNSQ